MKTNYYIGTAGWTYNDWQGVVYPSRRGARFNELKYIASLFNCVEINSTFYHIPDVRIVEKWCSKIEDFKDFFFIVKMWQGFTHERDDLIKREVESFKNCLEIFRSNNRLLCLLVQFPWSFRNTPENFKWMEKLIESFYAFPIAVEVRHSSWLTDKFLSYLRSLNIAFCNIDQPQLRQNLSLTKLKTADFSYLRLHGRNAKNWFAENLEPGERYDYLYSESEITDLTNAADEISKEAKRVIIIANNHLNGQAVCNALQIKSKITRKKLDVPEQMLRNFPELKKISLRPVPPQTDQLDLF